MANFITLLYLEGKHCCMDLQKTFEVSYQMTGIGWKQLKGFPNKNNAGKLTFLRVCLHSENFTLVDFFNF
ncbi:hypothetical protein ACDX66_03505 [Peribacillus frigoritolerans]